MFCKIPKQLNIIIKIIVDVTVLDMPLSELFLLQPSKSKFEHITLHLLFVSYKLITCTVPKSRMKDHFYSLGKDTTEKDRERIFTSAATSLAFSHLQRLFWSLTLDISSWNKINA